MSNAFMASAQKSKREQAVIEKSKSAEGKPEELVTINVRLPKELHRKAKLHSVVNDENMTQLIRRLLAAEMEKHPELDELD